MTLKQKIGAFIIKNSPVSPEIFSILRVEFRAIKNRVNYRINPFKRAAVKKLAANQDISLNVGCGPFGYDGWVNVDLMPLKNVSFTFDTRKRLPFNNSTVARIRVEHFFEHLDKKFEAPAFLDECKRVMKPGAVLRIAVPDAEKFIRAYTNNSDGDWKALGYDIHHLPTGFDTRIAILNHIFRQDGEHKYAYDWEAMQFILAQHGFKQITRQEYRQSLDDQLIDDQFNHSNHSLYVDSVK